MRGTSTSFKFILFFFLIISSLGFSQSLEHYPYLYWQADSAVDIEDATATLTGIIYEDSNGNATQESFEPGLHNIDVILIDAAGSQAVTTNSTGNWTANVVPGPVSVYVDVTDLPPGAIHTEGDDPNTPINDGGDPNTVVAIDQQTLDGGNDGFYFTGEIYGHLYFDLNGNGTQDGTEPDMPNVDVAITDQYGNPPTIVTTNASGDWTATVTAAQATVDIDDSDPDFPTGATQTEGTDPSTANVIANTSSFTENDGFYPEGLLTGHLYFDLNGNATQDATEPDMPNVDIEITDTFGNVEVVTTDANGDWEVLVPEGTTIINIDETDADFPIGAIQTEGTDPNTVTAVNAQTIFTENDGFFEEGTLTGHLYFDVNGNGTQESTEPDMPGVEVEISNALGSTNVVTDANGDWTYTGPIGPTTVTINESDPDFPTGAIQTEGSNPSTTTVTLNTVSFTENDGFYEQGTLTGHLYYDIDGNGTQNGNEPGMPDVDVVVTDALNNVQIVVTDANGDWSVELPAGPAVADIDETDADFPTGAVQTEGTDPTTTTVVNNQSVFSENDGFFGEGELTGHVYYDSDGNGTQDTGEPDLPNISIEITIVSGATQTLITDANGNWSFTAPIGPTSVYVDETDVDFPTGAVQTEGNNPTSVFVLNQSNNAQIDGFYIENLETTFLTGHLYLDTNANATQDVGEPDLPNIDVAITTSIGINLNVQTDANGNWTADVPEGNTTSTIDTTDPDFPVGAVQTEGTNPTTTNVQLNTTNTETPDGFNLPDLGTGSLSGHLYYDANANGTQDSAEPDLADVEVSITNSIGLLTTLTTNQNGDWSVTVPEGNTISAIDTADPDFPQGATQTEGTNPTTTLVGAGETLSEVNDGFVVPDTETENLSGHLYFDTNANGMQDASEPDLPNIDVSITTALGFVDVLTTDANGNWTLDVPIGNTLSEIDTSDPDFPNGVTQTQGTNPTTTNVVAGAPMAEVSDGFAQTSPSGTNTIAGHLYYDANGNATQDNNEPDLPDVEVEITNAAGVTQVLQTNQNGNWSLLVPVGNTVSQINESDPDFPTGATQTEGTNPTTTNVTTTGNFQETDGFYNPDLASNILKGHLYQDLNGNATQDMGEPDLPDIDVLINTSIGSTINLQTDLNGNWQAEVPVGTTISTVDVSDPDFPAGAIQSEGDNPTTSNVTEDVVLTEIDGFYIPDQSPEQITGHIYYDTNNNGVQNPGEPNLADIEIELIDAFGISQTVDTDIDGNWEANVPVGQVTSYINQNDSDFPSGAIQTEGTDPTTSTVSAGVVINEIDGFFIPEDDDSNGLEIYNAVSPNDDGKNDFFLIEGIENYPDNRVLIFNRWGVKVFETKAYGQNGRVFRGLSDGRATLSKGEKLPAGTYFYFLEFRNDAGKLEKIDGYLYIN